MRGVGFPGPQAWASLRDASRERRLWRELCFGPCPRSVVPSAWNISSSPFHPTISFSFFRSQLKSHLREVYGVTPTQPAQTVDPTECRTFPSLIVSLVFGSCFIHTSVPCKAESMRAVFTYSLFIAKVGQSANW